MDKDTLEVWLERYDKAQAEHKNLYDNPPEADENGRWPRWYVGSIEHAESEVKQCLAWLGRFVIQYREQMLEIVPTEEELLELEYDD